MQRALTFSATPTGKKVVLAIWVIAFIGILAGQLPGKFSDAEENESRSFLPADVDSTKALEVTEALAGAETAPTVIVYRRSGGLTAQDRQFIQREVGELNEATRAFANTTPFGNPAGREAREPFQVSEDGTSRRRRQT